MPDTTFDNTESLWEVTSRFLMSVSIEERERYLRVTGTEELKRIYEGALRLEDYEVCGIINKEIDQRKV